MTAMTRPYVTRATALAASACMFCAGWHAGRDADVWAAAGVLIAMLLLCSVESKVNA